MSFTQSILPEYSSRAYGTSNSLSSLFCTDEYCVAKLISSFATTDLLLTYKNSTSAK